VKTPNINKGKAKFRMGKVESREWKEEKPRSTLALPLSK
jgi:hypothetical protein